MLTSTLRALNSNADRILTPTDWDITALETMRTNFEAACTGLDAERIADCLVQNGKMKAVTCAEFAKEFDIDELRAQTIIAYINIMLKTTPDLFRM